MEAAIKDILDKLERGGELLESGAIAVTANSFISVRSVSSGEKQTNSFISVRSVSSGEKQTPIQCTVEESSDGARHSTNTQWVVPTIT
eukprot:scaffold43434_cov65-Phaeocystis_antarctica.AAC.1